jgi:predicted O-methyltransferase YrrM
MSTPPFIGDLSLRDAEILCSRGRAAKKILEFGVGGSTHIFSQCCPEVLVCVDTVPKWIDVTARRLAELQRPHTAPEFFLYNDVRPGKYDLVFVDGIDVLRQAFALVAWDWLEPTGVMLFHDTRRAQDAANVAAVCSRYFAEIRTVHWNLNHSNVTVIEKQPPLRYENWNIVEGKPLWQYGFDDSKRLADVQGE